jgi:ABC-2 type transport system ATP-binding protein
MSPRRVALRGKRGVLTAAAVVVALVLVGVVVKVLTAPASIRVRSQFVAGTPEADGTPVRLDTSVYFPATTPAPAILLAHGFGDTKASLASEAKDLAKHGYVVLAYTARGFGLSGGLIHLDAPDYEVADASKLISYLATLPQVLKDAPGDPRVGVAGSSYGGGLALLVAGYDKRVDAVAADITWNNLVTALFPNASGTTPGVFKKLWTAELFAAGAGVGAGTVPAGSVAGGSEAAGGAAGGSAATGGAAGGSAATGGAAAISAQCGRAAPELCADYVQAAATGRPSTALLALLKASSPSSVLSKITAPTLLTQGEQDSLFPLSEADANAKGIAAAGTPVKVMWRAGGHDGGTSQSELDADVLGWFDPVLRHKGSVNTSFELNQTGAGISSATGQRVSQTLHVQTGYPGIDGHSATQSLRRREAARPRSLWCPGWAHCWPARLASPGQVP